MKLEERCRKIELILSDVDGVLTDGGIIYDNQGIELKRFHVRDGFGIKLWRRAGHSFGILTARSSHIVKLRAAELEVDVVRQGFEDKLPVCEEVAEAHGLQWEQIAFVGDDLPDLPVLRRVGLGVAVQDAADELLRAAHLVTKLPGGRGAVREVIEFILRAKGTWADVARRYTG